MTKTAETPVRAYFVLVPLEPTEAMLAAADGVRGTFNAEDVWQAMIDAALKPQQPGENK